MIAESASAIPAFARRYNVPCYFCHEGFPKLSVIGEEFKERGFRLGQEERNLTNWLKSVPVSLRAGVNQSFVEDADSVTSGTFKLLSAGNLGRRFSYWIDQTWFAVSEGEDHFQRFGTDNAWLRVELIPEELYLRGGRIELDLPFTQARTPHLFGYDIYFANTGFESDNIGQHQDGIEVGGFFDDPTRWSVAVVAGRNSAEAERLSAEADDFDANVYGRFQHRIGESRAGAFVYLGRNTLARGNPEGGNLPPLIWEDELFRVGADGSLYLGNLNVYGVFMHGRNDNSIADAAHPNGTGETLTFSGGFLQSDFTFRDEISLTARLNVVRRPLGASALASETRVSLFPGLKIWFHNQFRLSFELGFQDDDRPTVGAIQALVAF